MKLFWKDETAGSDYKYYIIKRQTPTLRPFLDSHSHDYAEIFYVERGTFIHVINGRRKAVSKGDILFVPPETAEHQITEYDKNLSILQILFPVISFNFINERYTLPNWEELWHEESEETFHMKLIEQHWFENNFNKLLVSDNSLFEIERFLLNLFGLIKDVHRTEGPETRENWLDRAIKEIQEPENFRVGVQAFISLCGRSHEHVERELKKKTNQTITDVVNTARMNWASYMLLFSNQDIMDIADGCGLNSVSYFYKLFQNYYSISPSKYRKNLRSHSDVHTGRDFHSYMESIPDEGGPFVG